MKKACLLLMAFGLSATLVWRTEAKECGIYDYLQCGDSCIGYGNNCTCGVSEPWKGRNKKEGCCPSSSGSCIKDQKTGKDSLLKREIKISICFILLIFIGNVLCPNGTVKSLGEPCPAIGQCLTKLSWKTKVLCEDRPSTCSEEKRTSQICRGIPGVACPKK